MECDIAASSRVRNLVSYGNLHNYGIDQCRERADILHASNPTCLQSENQWQVFLWRRRRHWEVAVCPQGETCLVRVDIDIMDDSCRAAFESADATCAIAEVPLFQLFIVFDLVLANDSSCFGIRLQVNPFFDPKRDNVQSLGVVGPLTLLDVTEKAIETIHDFDSYGIIGGNCQHFAVSLLRSLDIPEEQSEALLTEDQRMAEVASRTVLGGYALGGAAKGAAALLGGGAVGVVAGHVLLGMSLASLGYGVITKGYEYTCEHHRRPSDTTSVEEVGETPDDKDRETRS